jgi:hypothetical protein
VVNKTPLSAKTNRQIGGNAPGVYLGKVQKTSGITSERMDEILRSHLIDPAAIRSDAFATFFKSRADAILDRIEAAMGKTIAGREFGSQMPAEAQNGDEDVPDAPEA